MERSVGDEHVLSVCGLMAIMMMAKAMAKGVVAVGSYRPGSGQKGRLQRQTPAQKTWQCLPQAPDPDLKREPGESPEPHAPKSSKHHGL